MAQESLTFKVGDATFKMIRVKHGSFNMGDDGHKVRMELTKDFYVSETEVTSKLWSAVMNTSWKSDVAIETRWDDVQEFLKRLSNMTGKNFRLLTETEWEYTARYGNGSKRYSGSNVWSDVNRKYLSPVKSSQEGALNKPNSLGIYGMSNMEGEWCSDWYKQRLTTKPQRDYQGPAEDDDPINKARVIRGKGNDYQEQLNLISSRTYGTEGFTLACIRLGLTAEGQLMVARQPSSFSKNPVNLPKDMSGVWTGTTTSMNRVTIDIAKQRRVLPAVNNKIGYGTFSLSSYMGQNTKYYIITKIVPERKNSATITIESIDGSEVIRMNLQYGMGFLSVKSSISNFNKMLLKKI